MKGDVWDSLDVLWREASAKVTEMVDFLTYCIASAYISTGTGHTMKTYNYEKIMYKTELLPRDLEQIVITKTWFAAAMLSTRKSHYFDEFKQEELN